MNKNQNEEANLPAKIYEGFCPNCNARIEYALFQSSFYGFRTFYSISNNVLIRISDEHINYHNINDIKGYLITVIENERSSEDIIDLNNQVYCNKCNLKIAMNELRDRRFCREEHKMAIAIN